MRFWKRLRLTLEMIKFEHSVFALPFALTGALLAFRETHLPPRIFGEKLLWIVIAMVGARSAAMAFNRLLDAEIDARNPRTRMRHIPAGILSTGFGWGFVAVSALVRPAPMTSRDLVKTLDSDGNLFSMPILPRLNALSFSNSRLRQERGKKPVLS